MTMSDHRVVGFFQRCGPASRFPAGGRHAIGQGAAEHEHEVDQRHHHEALPDADVAGSGKVVHQGCRQRRTDHGAAAKAHDRHAGGHAAFVREPLDQGRDRRNVTKPQADTANHPGAQPHQPQLVGIDAESGNQQAAAPAQGRHHPGLARPGVFQPAAPDGRRTAEEDEEQRVDPAEHRDRPVTPGGKHAHQEVGFFRADNRRTDTDGLRQRQPEHRKTVGHADAQVNGQGRWRHQPPVEARTGDDPLLGQETGRARYGAGRDAAAHCCVPLVGMKRSPPSTLALWQLVVFIGERPFCATNSRSRA
ncbi:hypothetical protein D3C78_783200 [compost metagenome]